MGLLETAQRLAELPATEAAVRKGKLSEAQTREIASAASASPSSEKELLGVAQRDGLGRLREKAAQVRASATSDELARYDRIRKSRYLRHWSDVDGAFRLDGKLTPNAGAVVVAALEPYKDQVFKHARKNGERESYAAYAADALVALATDARSGANGRGQSGPKTLVRVLVDHQALERGHTEPGELCTIEGIGPIPVATAKALATDSILAALSTDGTDIYKVSHLGRTITARQRTALEVRDPHCVVPGCGARHHLEIDHITGYVATKKTELGDLGRLCPWHHYLKTHKGWVLSGGPGKWSFEPPPDKRTLLTSGADPPP